eukprot:5397753-Lingulodinium_polyedra.AAC.1
MRPRAYEVDMAASAEWLQSQIDSLGKCSLGFDSDDVLTQAKSTLGNVKALVAASVVYQLVLKSAAILTEVDARSGAVQKVKDAMAKNKIELHESLTDRLTLF